MKKIIDNDNFAWINGYNQVLVEVEEMMNNIYETEGWTNHHNIEYVITIDRLRRVVKKELQKLKGNKKNET